MGKVRFALAVCAALMAAACGTPNQASVLPSAIASAAAKASLALPSGTIPPSGSAGIVSPIGASQVVTVLNGYDNPMPGGACVKGYGHDHCGNQEFGLDLAMSKPEDLLVLAPVAGSVAWECVDKACPPATVPGGCLGITPDAFPKLNLTVCHMSSQRATGHVTPGQVLGLRRAADPWVHVSLDVRADANGPLPADKWTQGVPFSGAFTISGHDFAPAASPTPDLHKCDSFFSGTAATGDTSLPSPLPATAKPDLAACGAGPSPSPTPTASPTQAPAVDVASLLPSSIGGVRAKIAPTLTGSAVFDGSPFLNAVRTLAASLGVSQDQVQLVSASYAPGTHVVIYRLAGAPEAQLLAGWLAGPEAVSGAKLSKATLGGKSVMKWAAGGPFASYIYVRGDVVFIVTVSSSKDGTEAMSKLP